MKIKIVTDKVSIGELRDVAAEFYVSMVKGAADIEQGVFAFGGEYHIDAATVLASHGSDQAHVWGFNFYFDKPKTERLEYVALINIRPALGNRDMFIGNAEIRKKIELLVNSKIV